MRIQFAVLAASLALGACDGSQPRYHTRTPFHAGDVAWATATGANSLTGAVEFRSGGVAHPCHGVPVQLVPDSAYARLRLKELYGSDAWGISSGPNFGSHGPERYDARWLESGRSTTCSQGRFGFEGVPDGVWYVVSSWMAPGAKDAHGISLFKRVELRGGQAATINLP